MLARRRACNPPSDIRQNGFPVHADLLPRRRFPRLLAASVAVALVVAAGVLQGGAEPASAAASAPTVRGELLGERSLPPNGGEITERVTYDNLTVDNDYIFLVDLENPDGSATPIQSLMSLTPTEPGGTIDLVLTVPAGYAGRTLVATVWLFDVAAPGDAVARYADFTDPLQTLVIRAPSVHGALLGERMLPPSGGTVTERVTYDNLVPGDDYIFLVDLENPDGTATPIQSLMSLTPTEASGTIDVVLTVPSGYAGRTLVATVWLFDVAAPGDAVARHADFTDPQQTLVIGSPVIHSSLTDQADGDRVLAVSGGTLVDSVSYEQLDPGTEYTVSSVLMRGSDASATPLTAETSFTPSEPDGSVELTFTVPSGYAGESLVSFSRIYAGTDESAAPIAEDVQIDDPTQTVVVQSATPPPPPAESAQAMNTTRTLAASGTTVSPIPLMLAAILLAAGAAILAARRRRSALSSRAAARDES
jgi:hypothetical protein